VTLLLNHAISPGPRCVVTVRPETFAAKNLTRSSVFMELEEQAGPRPDQVILHHIRKFLKQPEIYTAKIPYLKESQIDLLKSYLSTLLTLNEERRHGQSGILARFFEDVCGPSIRLGLRLADGLLIMDDELLWNIQNETLTLYHVIRNLIRRGKPQYSIESGIGPHYHLVENLFDVRTVDENGRLLVKARILAYLNLQSKTGPTLGEFRNVLGNFGYSETDLIRQAVNDLLIVQRQLIRSDDRDGYQTAEEFQGSSATRISITDIGKNYLHLMGNMDYLQEVMFDCRVEPNEFIYMPDVSATYEILVLISKFLSTLYSGPIKLDTETGRLKVYNYGHAQTIYDRLQDSSGTRAPQRGENRQPTRHQTWRASDPTAGLEEASFRRTAEPV
jgi:hypothetical protein